MRERAIIVTLGFGSVLINTMPVWIGELARHPAISASAAGTLGSVVLLSAAVTCVGSGFGAPLRLQKALVPLCLILLALGAAMPVAVILGAACGLGLALGALTGRALAGLSGDPASLRHVSAALSLGLIVSLAVYLALPVLGVPALWTIAALSLSLMRVGAPGPAAGTPPPWTALRSGFPIGHLAFFVMMGAYWTYLELFGEAFAQSEMLPFWLLASLLSGALGAHLAARIPPGGRRRVRGWSVLAAALTGAASYAAPTLPLLGASIVANGFFLFLFFPLYLDGSGAGAPRAMAAYLLGFACGGAVGALVIRAGGYPALAVAILVGGAIALIPARRLGRP
ncbi:MAG: hypothetical protein AAGG09_03350 [Pseudomonadota bacterium]